MIIDARHFEDGAMADYRARYDAHPSHVLMIRDFLGAETVAAVARFLGEQATWRTVYHVNSGDRVDRAAWDAAPASDRFYTAGLLDEEATAAAAGPDADVYRAMIAAFAHPDYLRWIEALTGFTLGRLGMVARAFRRGEFAGAHVDDAADRRLAWTLYLTPGWRPSYGATLFMMGQGGDVTPVPAAYNTLVIFDATVKTLHRVTAVTDAAGDRARISVGGWISEGSVAP